MSVFHGNWNEDAEAFLNSYLECMGSAGDEKLARDFVYYLEADSDADEWFEELQEDEKKSWASIEVLFQKKWFKQEVLGTKKVKTNENGPKIIQKPVFSLPNPSNAPTLSPMTSSAPTKAQTSPHVIKLPSLSSTSVPLTTSEISQNTTVFSSQTPSATVSNQAAPSTAITELESRSTTAGFTQKVEKVEKSQFS